MSYEMFAVHNEKAEKILVYFYSTRQYEEERRTHIQVYNYARGTIYKSWMPSQPSPVPMLKDSDLIGYVDKFDVLDFNSTFHKTLDWTDNDSASFRAECDGNVAHVLQQKLLKPGTRMDRKAQEEFKHTAHRRNVTAWAAAYMDSWIHNRFEELGKKGLVKRTKPPVS